MNYIIKYFQDLTDQQYQQFEELDRLYRFWNDKINVISRKDIDSLYLHHVLHSLSIAKWISLKPGSRIFDLGSGGGFPGIPLAILYPDVNFHLLDARAKKIKVIRAIVDELALYNIKATHGRAEEHKGQYDFVVSRAVAPLDKLWTWTRNKISGSHHNERPNGLIALKGGDLNQEMSEIEGNVNIYRQEISEYFEEDYFRDKYLLHLVKKR